VLVGLLESSERLVLASKKNLEKIKILSKMKRKGFLIERIADMDNLEAADEEAQKGGKEKKNRYIRRHNLHRESDLKRLQIMILSLRFPEIHYVSKFIKEDNKMRDIGVCNFFPWRILHHAIMRVIGDDIYKSLIADTFASVKGRGQVKASLRLRHFLRRYPECNWFVKTDYKKFYQSVDHDFLIEKLRHKFKDEKFIKLIELTVTNYQTSDEIYDEIENEKEKNRNAYWGVHQPAFMHLCVE